MKMRIKKTNNDGLVRVETSGEIKEVLINEDFLRPNAESVSLCFRGKDSSGIIELTTTEVEMLANTVSKRLHLIKDSKKFKE